MGFLFPAFFIVSVALQVMILFFEYGNFTAKPVKNEEGKKRWGHLRPVTQIKATTQPLRRAYG